MGLAAFEQCGKKRAPVPCLQDLSMQELPPDQRYYFAANLRNTAEMLPHFTTQMLFTVTTLPVGQAFVSIYESGSTDTTGVHSAWLPLISVP
jgi:hypothetical protein